MTNADQDLIDDAKALALVTVSSYHSLEGVELTNRQYTFSELQLKKIAELIKVRALEQETYANTKRLDWLQAQSEHGYGWVARKSELDRGYRVHQDPSNIHNYTVREAIDAAMKEGK